MAKKKAEKPIVTPLDENAQATADLTNLLETRGWQYLKRILEANVKHYEELILDTERADNEKREDWIKYRKVYAFAARLPQELLDDLKENKPIPINLDPYSDDGGN